jgi:hypothetical protein
MAAAAAAVVGAKLLGFNLQGVRHLWEASRLGIDEAKISNMNFPALRLDEAIKIFTERIYQRELSFVHP